MLRELIITLIMTCSTSCGILPKNDTGFNPQRQFFEEQTHYSTKGIPISFGDADADIAQCKFVRVEKKIYGQHILVNRDVYNTLSEPWKLMVIAHELIHCRLGKDHEHVEMDDNFFWIMDAHLPTDWPITIDLVIKQLSYYAKKVEK